MIIFTNKESSPEGRRRKMMKIMIITLLLILSGCNSSGVSEINKAGEKEMDKNSKFSVATFAGGCFWCSQADFSKKGIKPFAI